jgi:hypothetical protein
MARTPFKAFCTILPVTVPAAVFVSSTEATKSSTPMSTMMSRLPDLFLRLACTFSEAQILSCEHEAELAAFKRYVI